MTVFTSSIITESRRRCIELNLDPSVMPEFNDYLSPGKLWSQCRKYEEILDVTNFFVEKFLASVYGAPVLIAITDGQGYILKFNGDPTIQDTVKNLGMIEGHRFHEGLGTNSITLSLQYDRPIQIIGEEHYHYVLHGLACYSVPFHYGTNRELLGTLSLMTFVGEAHAHLLALLCTIVDSIERELLLRKQNTQLHILNQVLLETSYHGVIITDVHGNIVDCNANMDEILREFNPGRNKFTCCSVLSLEPLGSYFQYVLTHNQEFVGKELSLRIGGSDFHFILDVVPIYDHNRSLIRIVGNLRDISNIKNTEQLLRNADKLAAVGQLAAGIAHEIRNPLTTVQGMLQLSKDRFQPHYYDLILSELARMKLIVGEFLMLGKPQAIEFKQADCLLILNEVLSIYETQTIMNGISIETNFLKTQRMMCDANQIKQVFINILKNCLEALPYGGTIRIDLDVQGSHQRIRFKDDGEGMTEEILTKIGQPFCSTKKDGNGLGIMVTKKIIDSHKGQIHFSSGLNSGTTVEILLPCI